MLSYQVKNHNFALQFRLVLKNIFNKNYATVNLFQEILLLIFVTFSSMAIFSMLGLKLTPLLFNVDALALFSPDYASMDNNTINALKFFNMFATIGTFLVPALIMPQILRRNTAAYLALNKKPDPMFLVYITVLFAAIYPFLEWTLMMNQNLQFPSFMQDIENKIREQDKAMELLTLRFLEMENAAGLFINLVIIALIPAFIEELFFRGLVQTLVHKWLRNIHVAIIFTAILFSMVHVQFLGIVPRFILGLILGYVFFWSGSIWSAVFFHFLNNASAVLLVFLSQKNFINFKIDEPMNSSNIVIILSFGIAAAICLYLANRYNKKRDRKDDWVKVHECFSVSEAEILKGKLEEGEIDAVIMNKKDSSIQTFGQVEIYVKPMDKDAALKVISEQNILAENENE
jgi:membrane protease YdiL (CAAX protease family)